MPEKATVQRARRKAKEGKAPSTQAGEFVREEIHHIREGKHGARSAQQAIAIGLSKARRAGVKLPPQPGDDKPAMPSHRRSKARPSKKRSAASVKALRKESTSSASHRALARQARRSARRRPAAARHAAAMKAVRTKGPAVRHRAARKAAATRSRSAH